jgi:methylase of polypeptide subunit release factors
VTTTLDPRSDVPAPEPTRRAGNAADSTTDFGGLTIAHGDGHLEPRPWTILQSRWAVELAADLPPGPVLELCAGVGHIGLVVAHRTRRELVQVELDPTACELARTNAEVAGLGGFVEVRQRSVGGAAEPGEIFPLVLADPPYLPTDEVHRFPDDPVTAIDGGPDGLEVARECAAEIAAVLAPGGAALVQLRDREQAERLAGEVHGGLTLAEVRTDGPRRAIALFLR